MVVLTLICGAAAAASSVTATRVAPPHFADATDAAMVGRGRALYRQYCASCHGRYLQGQPLWALADHYAGRRAPAHDQTGHTWEHADEALFRKTKTGRFPGVAPATVSAMPAFSGVLEDRDIVAVIAFIKARWPIGLQALQALRNPGHAGMPTAARLDWTFPPDCGTGSRAAAPSG
jgi:mono/diheme cytochrome c family protein